MLSDASVALFSQNTKTSRSQTARTPSLNNIGTNTAFLAIFLLLRLKVSGNEKDAHRPLQELHPATEKKSTSSPHLAPTVDTMWLVCVPFTLGNSHQQLLMAPLARCAGVGVGFSASEHRLFLFRNGPPFSESLWVASDQRMKVAFSHKIGIACLEELMDAYR